MDNIHSCDTCALRHSIQCRTTIPVRLLKDKSACWTATVNESVKPIDGDALKALEHAIKKSVKDIPEREKNCATCDLNDGVYCKNSVMDKNTFSCWKPLKSSADKDICSCSRSWGVIERPKNKVVCKVCKKPITKKSTLQQEKPIDTTSVYGVCPKHPEQSMINCPECFIEKHLVKEKEAYVKGSDAAHKSLLDTLYNELEAASSEHIQMNGLRFYGVHFNHVIQILQKYGFKYEPKF